MVTRFSYLIAAPLIVFSMTAAAQAGDGAQRALAKAQFMLRQANAEKVALEQKVAELQKDIDRLQSEISTSKKEFEAKYASLNTMSHKNQEKWRSDRESLEAELNRIKSEGVRKSETIAKTQEKLDIQTENFTKCYVNNKKLYDVNRELLREYENKGPVDALAQREPFTGISKVEIENLMQDYQYRLEDLKLPTVDVEVDTSADSSGQQSE